MPNPAGSEIFDEHATTGDFNNDGRHDGEGKFTDASQLVAVLHATPVVADFNGDGALDVLELDSQGDILYRQGIPLAPGSFLPPVTINPGFPSRDIALLTDQRRPGGRERRRPRRRDLVLRLARWALRFGSARARPVSSRLRSSSADLNGDGLDDLVVRNAGDGTLSVFFGAAFDRSTFIGPLDPGLVPPAFLAPVILPVALGASDVQAVDTSASGRLDLVLTNKLTGQVSILRNLGGGGFAPPENVQRQQRAVGDRHGRHARGHQPGSDGGRRRRTVHDRRSDRSRDDQPGLEHARHSGRPGRRPLRQSGHDSVRQLEPSGRPHGRLQWRWRPGPGAVRLTRA